MSEIEVAIAMIMFGIICFVLGLRYGYRWHKSEIFPREDIKSKKCLPVGGWESSTRCTKNPCVVTWR